MVAAMVFVRVTYNLDYVKDYGFIFGMYLE